MKFIWIAATNSNEQLAHCRSTELSAKWVGVSRGNMRPTHVQFRRKDIYQILRDLESSNEPEKLRILNALKRLLVVLKDEEI